MGTGEGIIPGVAGEGTPGPEGGRIPGNGGGKGGAKGGKLAGTAPLGGI